MSFCTRARPHAPLLARLVLVVGWVVLPPAILIAADSGPVDALKAEADRWIDLEARAASERNDWRAQKEVLETSVAVLQQERALLETKVEANDVAADLFRARIDKARTDQQTHQTAHAAVAETCAALEKRLRALWPRLPEPLQEKTRAQLDRLAAGNLEAGRMGVSERMQIVILILTAIDQFNNSLTIAHHLRDNGAGQTVDVKVLYWGLAMGYGIDTRGEHAWLLRPGPQGWTWEDATDQREAIDTLIKVRERQTPVFVVLPAGETGGAR